MTFSEDLRAKRVAEELAAESQLEMHLVRALWGGVTTWGIRPTGLGEGQGFSIGFSRSLHSAEALFISDQFAGNLVRRIGDYVVHDPSVWVGIENEASLNGIGVYVVVNDEHQPDLTKLPTEPWRALEIECRKRIRRTSKEGPGAEVSVTKTCLSLALAGLEVVVGDDFEPLPEGASVSVLVNRYERDPVNRMRCIEIYGAICWVCDFDFAKEYGALGAGFIVVHHIVPISQMGADYLVSPSRDLVPLCPNCHAMVHRSNPPLTPQLLRSMLGLDHKVHGASPQQA